MSVTFGKDQAEMVVSPVGYGCMGLTAFYGDKTVDDEHGIAVLKKAYELGVRHFDTAQAYTRRQADGSVKYNEQLIGDFLKTLSDEEKKGVTVATKFMPFDFKTRSPKWNEEEFIAATKSSLQRLGVDCIDLYYFHRVIPKNIAPVEAWMGAAKKLVEEGLVKRIGLSEVNATYLREAHAVHPITCIQQEWSLFARDIEESVVPTCKELGVGIIAYSPIGRGFLAGRFTSKENRPKDWRSTVPYLTDENIEKNLALLEELKAIATKKNCSVGQLCLAWLIVQGAVPIPGTTSIKHLEDNMGSTNVKLSDEEVKELGILGSKVVGERGTEAYLKASHNNL